MRTATGSGAVDEFQSRVNGVLATANAFERDSLTTCSDAVSRLVKMSGDGSLDEKVDGVRRLASVIDEPDLNQLVSNLETLAQTLSQRYEDWGWDAMLDSLEHAPGIENGIDDDVMDYVADDVGDT